MANSNWKTHEEALETSCMNSTVNWGYGASPCIGKNCGHWIWQPCPKCRGYTKKSLDACSSCEGAGIIDNKRGGCGLRRI